MTPTRSYWPRRFIAEEEFLLLEPFPLGSLAWDLEPEIWALSLEALALERFNSKLLALKCLLLEALDLGPSARHLQFWDL